MSARREQRWPWWPLLPLYPYGRRRTLVRELIPGQVWSFEQLLGLYYVAVPIRMTVLKLRQGLMLYAPVAPTAEVREALRELEQRHGPVLTIVLPTTSGLEHKLPVPAMVRAFPAATLWVAPQQWSFPLRLPLPWLGFPTRRTRVLIEQGLPHGDELDWRALGPLDLGIGSFGEVACCHRASGALLLTDALFAIEEQPPEIFTADPTPLLFHARERGEEPLGDGPEQRRQGWWRLVLFATYLRPPGLEVLNLLETCRGALRPGLRDTRSHFGLYPFRWSNGWQEAFLALLGPGGEARLQVAPVVERLVFPRQRGVLAAWLRELAGLQDLRWVIPAHHAAPLPCAGPQLLTLAEQIETSACPQAGAWTFLRELDERIIALGLVPATPRDRSKVS
ncbi:DUF4336 domain-containing protein [Cyanobium sp. Morenito 9A2]|uniref:DUF4336 domain-containing protein n=1 Tax=Cyanobium sp. Morenito 9A2 TaxID=2823718 RepID=UPI0020CF46A1|nr:DUF4336 domain-containing protein [Cyanobium sp. Morenito 9A2]MCP9849407.1 DUF4336 domain-containing protein [Cyanobium sp. Morenito 9A2]